MPVHLRSLVVIMVLSLAVLLVSRPIVTKFAIAPEDYKRRAMVWVLITLAAYLCQNYWLFAALTVPLMWWAGAKDSNRLSLALFLVFVIPPFPASISSGGLFRDSILQVDHLRWLSIALFLPAYLSLRKDPTVPPFGRTGIDKCVLAYLCLLLVLQALNTTVTNLLRIAVQLFLDTFLPYYVASRAVRDLRSFRDAVMSFLVGVLIMCPIAMFEFARNWLLYSGLGQVLGLPFWGMGNTLNRGDGILRAAASTGHAIALGYVMAVAMGLFAFIKPAIASPRWWTLGFLALVGGLIAAMSRGPWVGAAAMLMILVLTGPNVMSNLAKILVACVVLVPALLMTDVGYKIIDYLPFIGTVEAQNVEFRQRLLTVAIGVLWHFPFFGSLEFMAHPALEQMRGSDGIIDVVNTYLGVSLSTGLVGLTLFLAPFVGVILGILRSMASQRDKGSELYLLGRALLAVVVCILITIGTVSSIVVIPIVYVVVIGLGAGYLQLVAAQSRLPQAAASPMAVGAPGAGTPPPARGRPAAPDWQWRGR